MATKMECISNICLHKSILMRSCLAFQKSHPKQRKCWTLHRQIENVETVKIYENIKLACLVWEIIAKVIECEASFQLSFSNLLQLLLVGLAIVSHDIQTDMYQIVMSLITFYVCSAAYNQSGIIMIQKRKNLWKFRKRKHISTVKTL